MRTSFVWVAILLAGFAQLLTAANSLSDKETAEGWILLYDGHSLDGWTKLGGANWRVAGDGDMLALNGDDGWIVHSRVFTNFVLKCEFKVPERSRSEIYLRANAEGDPRTTGYEVRINNNDPDYSTGSLVGPIAARPAAPEGDKWHTFEISAMGDHIVVKLDGQTLVDGHNGKSESGHIGFQFNKGNKVEYRNIRVRPL
jgi:hypothetical protein